MRKSEWKTKECDSGVGLVISLVFQTEPFLS